MKKALLSGIALAVLTGSALGADLPSKKSLAPAYLPPPPPMWTGFYVGLNVGGTWSDNNSVSISAFDTNPVSPANFGILVTQLNGAYPASASSPLGGFIGGGQIGYNWQFHGSFVAGLEADIQGSTASNRVSSALTNTVWFGVGGNSPYGGTAEVGRRLDYLGTVRGRLGYLITPTLLAYGTGGLAYGGVSLSYSGWVRNSPGNVLAGTGSFSDTRVGWTAGAGLEWLFMPNWSAKAEYLYYDLGSASASFFGCLGGAGAIAGNCSTATATSRFNGHVVRAGLNYHFNFGAAPVVAKY